MRLKAELVIILSWAIYPVSEQAISLGEIGFLQPSRQVGQEGQRIQKPHKDKKTAVHSQFTSMVQDLSYQAIRRCVWSMVYILESDLHTPNTARQKTRGVSAPMAKILAFCFCCFIGSFVLVYVFQVFCKYSIRKWNQHTKYVLQEALQRWIGNAVPWRGRNVAGPKAAYLILE